MFEFEQRYRRELKSKLEERECREAFEKLRIEHSIFNLYPTVEYLCDLLNPGNKNYAHKDEVMAILLTELHRNNAIYPLINIMFWDSLYRLYRQRRFWVTDPERLLNEIWWSFYQSLMNHNPERISRKIDVNIFLNTKKRVIAWEKGNLRYEEVRKELEDLCKDGLSPFDFKKSNHYPQEMKAYLLSMLYRKVISEAQYELLIETLVYKRMSQKKWAEKRGIPDNTARALKLRAKRAIKHFEEEKRRKNEII